MSLILMYTRSGIVYIQGSPQAIKTLSEVGEPAATELKAVIDTKGNAESAVDFVKAMVGNELADSIKMIGSLSAGVAAGEATAIAVSGFAATIVAAPWALLAGAVAGLTVGGVYGQKIYDEGWDNAYKLGQKISDQVGSAYRDARNMNVYVDPLMLDLDGDGLELEAASSAILFDHNADGIRTSTGWIGADDGILVRDLDSDGWITTGRELFGIDTMKSNGQYASSGFDALRELDSNGDGNFTSADTAWNSVQVWRDLNQDGMSDAGELSSLDSSGIRRIGMTGSSTNSTGGTQAGTTVSNNLIAQSASFTRVLDGIAAELTVGAIDLEANNFHRHYTASVAMTPQAIALPNMAGSGRVRDLAEAMSADSALAGKVEAFSNATTRDAQLAMIDGIIAQWARGSDYWSTLENSLGVTLDVNALPLGMSEAHFRNMISVLEVFNGDRFFAQPGTAAARAQGLSVRYNDSTTYDLMLPERRVEILEESYSALKDSVYGALTLQTRLKPYLDAVSIKIDATGISVDTTALMNKLNQARAVDERDAVFDLIDLDRHAGNFLESVGFNSFDLLGTWIENLPADSSIRADLVGAGGALAVNSVVGTAFDDLYFGSSANDQLLAGDGDDRMHGGAGNDSLYGGNGNDVLYGGAGNDELIGGDGVNLLVGGKGNDKIEFGAGIDIIHFNRGDGSDTIRRAFSDDAPTSAGGTQNGAARSVLKLGASIIAADVQVQRCAPGHGADDITLSFGQGDDVTFTAPFGNPLRGLKYVEFSDGTQWTGQALLEMVVGPQTGTAENDTLLGLYDAENDLSGGAGNDVIYGNDRNDRLMGGTGDDRLCGSEGDDLLDGGAGDDWLNGGGGNDTYLFGRGSGNDTVASMDSTQGKLDTVRFGLGISQSDITVTRQGLDLKLSIAGGSDTLTVNSYFNATASYGLKVEKFLFADGTMWDGAAIDAKFAPAVPPLQTGLVLKGSEGMDFLMGKDSDDSLDGMGGNDYLLGGSGNDTYRFGRGYGTDTVMEIGATASNADKVLFGEGVTADQLWFQKSGFDLEIGVIGTTDRLNISMWYLGPAYTVENFQTSDGKTLLDTQVQNLVQAMAGFAPPSAGQTTLPANYQSSLNTVIAANWH